MHSRFWHQDGVVSFNPHPIVTREGQDAWWGPVADVGMLMAKTSILALIGSHTPGAQVRFHSLVLYLLRRH
jgi:hypothetical protein